MMTSFLGVSTVFLGFMVDVGTYKEVVIINPMSHPIISSAYQRKQTGETSLHTREFLEYSISICSEELEEEVNRRECNNSIQLSYSTDNY